MAFYLLLNWNHFNFAAFLAERGETSNEYVMHSWALSPLMNIAGGSAYIARMPDSHRPETTLVLAFLWVQPLGRSLGLCMNINM